MMEDRVGGHRLSIGATTSYIDPRCNNRGGKRLGPAGAIKRCSKHKFYAPPQLLTQRTL
jgi:hypothetical protein